MRVIFADNEFAIIYECYGETDDHGRCSDRAYIELLGRQVAPLSEERRAQVVPFLRQTCFEPGDFVQTQHDGGFDLGEDIVNVDNYG